MTGCRDWQFVMRRYFKKSSQAYPFTFHSRGGRRILVEDRDELTTIWHVFFGSEYDVPATATTIVDLGANIGAFALWASERFPQARIVSVEPFPATYEKLRRTIEQNGLETRIQTMQAAVAVSDGEIAFDATPNKRSYCRGIVDGAQGIQTINVPGVTLESLLNQLKLEELDCLKMDIEGGEYDLLGSAAQETLRRIKVVTMEYHDVAKAQALWASFDKAGFRRTRFTLGGWSGLATYERQ